MLIKQAERALHTLSYNHPRIKNSYSKRDSIKFQKGGLNWLQLAAGTLTAMTLHWVLQVTWR